MKTFSLSGGGLAGPPSACAVTPDRVHVFAAGPGGTIWCWQLIDETMLAPFPLPPNGSIPAEGICAIASGPGQAEVFAVDAGSRLPVWWRGNRTSWTIGQQLLPGPSIPAIPVAVVAASPDDIDVVAVGNDNTPWWWHWNGSIWTPPTRLPDGASLSAVRIAAVAPSPGRLDVFAVGSNRHLWHWWKEGATPWNIQDLGGDLPAEGVSAVTWGPGRVDVFAASRLPGSPLLHWYGDNGNFSAVENLGGSLAQGAVSVVSRASDRLDIFAITRDQRLAHWQWDGGRWFGPGLRGENIPAGDVSAVARTPHRLDAFVTGAGNSLLQWPGGGVENGRNQRWENWPTTVQKPAPPGIVKPDSLEELVNIVREAEQSNLGVRAVGTGWSSSDVAISSGYVVETDLLGGVLTNVLPTSLNPEGAGMRLLHVEAGIKLDKLVAVLRSLEWELKTLGGSTGQSLAGAISTSVHGMDPTVGPLPDMVRAIHLVGPGGIQHWTEPSSKVITDRIALRAALGVADENIHYDDDWFNSVLVSIGSLGIIYSFVIELDDKYDLVETRERFDWTAVRARLLASDATNPLKSDRQGVQVVISPYASADGSRNCYLTTRRRDIATDVKPPGLDFAWVIRDLTPTLFSSWRADRATVDEFIIRATDLQQGSGTARGLAHSHSGGSDPGGVRGIGLEMIFDASTTDYLDFVDDALEIIRAAYYDSNPQPWSYLGWISLRFQGRSVAYLSPQHEAALSCSVELAAAYRRPELPGIGWADTPALLSLIEQAGRSRGGVQHWGMNAAINAQDVERKYRRLDTWRRVRWELTRGGTIKTFDSDFTRRCGLSVPPAMVPAADYDGDGKADLAVWRPGSGGWQILNSAGGTERLATLGEVGDIPVPGDYDGDGKIDLAVWRPRTGMWIVAPSAPPPVAMPMATGRATRPGRLIAAAGDTLAALSQTAPLQNQQWGQVEDIPVPGDYDGDGRTDFAVWRPSTGEWFIIDSTTKKPRTRQWGQAGDIPVPGDYDGDGRTDMAVWRPSTGEWFVIDSTTNTPRTRQWGQAGDIPVPGDYDGDGRTDMAVWRPSTGEWFVIDSTTNTPRTRQWGLFSDIPMPGDYDGDGRTDFAVWRPSNGIWWIVDSATGSERGVQWGRFGDVPV
jgi:hypothetical protein